VPQEAAPRAPPDAAARRGHAACAPALVTTAHAPLASQALRRPVRPFVLRGRRGATRVRGGRRIPDGGRDGAAQRGRRGVKCCVR